MIHVIYGPPGVGKTTYVKEHADRDAIIWQYDDIMQALTLRESHAEASDEQHRVIMSLRKKFIKKVKTSKTDVFFTCCNLSDELREAIGDDAEYIELTATKEELYERVDNDDTRPDKDFEHKKIDRYFEKKTEKKGAKKMAAETRVRRDFNFEVRANESEEHGHYIAGRPVVFDSPYDVCGIYTEVIDAGALDETDLKDVRFLVNHNLSMIPLARSRNNNKNSTMRLNVVPEGMDIEADLDTERNATALELYSAVERGDISGMSFMFSIDGYEWENLETENPIKHITRIGHIFEVSAVTDPAYTATTIEARAAEADALESARAALESAKAERADDERRERMRGMISDILGGKENDN